MCKTATSGWYSEILSSVKNSSFCCPIGKSESISGKTYFCSTSNTSPSNSIVSLTGN
uniref:Uncharacterized protein n=1 Tax=uncultured marine virus TaxID=186617 RepID=A0A0F7L6C3_9VIRU|nr:hypothetical protein [uncultured marine virus]